MEQNHCKRAKFYQVWALDKHIHNCICTVLYCTVPHAQWTFKGYKLILKAVLLIHAEYSSYHCIISNLKDTHQK